MYGFPPGVGATGTAALLNVPKSLEKLLGSLRDVSWAHWPAGLQGWVVGNLEFGCPGTLTRTLRNP